MAGKRILLCDDSQLILTACAGALRGAGYEVIAVGDLGPLMAAAEHDRFDLVLMDVQMPELYGDDIAAVLRHKHGITAPIYLFSSLPAKDLAALVRDNELDGFVSKNDGLEALVASVDKILSE